MVATGEWDREEVKFQRVDTGMALGMEPAQEKDLRMEPGTGPKKALEPGPVMAQAPRGRAEETEQIRKI